MNRESAEKTAREIYSELRNISEPEKNGMITRAADIIELACGQDAAHKHDLRTCPAMRALEGLTPGGSEYIDDIPRCVDAVRDTRDSLMKEIQRRAKREHACGETAWVSREGELDELQYAIEAVLIRRHLERTLEGHTLDTAKELAKVVRPLPSPPTGRTEEK